MNKKYKLKRYDKRFRGGWCYKCEDSYSYLFEDCGYCRYCCHC